jgi:hypothetical protein
MCRASVKAVIKLFRNTEQIKNGIIAINELEVFIEHGKTDRRIIVYNADILVHFGYFFMRFNKLPLVFSYIGHVV